MMDVLFSRQEALQDNNLLCFIHNHSLRLFVLLVFTQSELLLPVHSTTVSNFSYTVKKLYVPLGSNMKWLQTVNVYLGKFFPQILARSVIYENSVFSQYIEIDPRRSLYTSVVTVYLLLILFPLPLKSTSITTFLHLSSIYSLVLQQLRLPQRRYKP